jgi:hypothetical protein
VYVPDFSRISVSLHAEIGQEDDSCDELVNRHSYVFVGPGGFVRPMCQARAKVLDDSGTPFAAVEMSQ